MLRKTVFALVAAAALGITALVPTSASARGGHGGGHGGFHGGAHHGNWSHRGFGYRSWGHRAYGCGGGGGPGWCYYHPRRCR
jgi:hypothetical protein